MIKMKNNPYKLAWIACAVIFFSTMTYQGMPALLDDIAETRFDEKRLIMWCNQSNRMTSEPVCNGGTVGME